MRRRANGEGTDIFEYKGGYAAVLSVRTIEGRASRKWIYGKTKAEVQAKRREFLRSYQPGFAVVGRSPTLKDYGNEWLHVTLPSAIAAGRLQETTRAGYRDLWLRHIVGELGHLRLDQLTPRVLRQFFMKKAVTVSQRTGEPLSGRTQQMIFGCLRKALNDAVRDDVIAVNPMSKVQSPRASRSTASALRVPEVEQFLKVAVEHELFALWLLLLGTGLRIGEALALQWTDIDLDTQTLTVRRSVARLRQDFDPALGRHPTRLVVKEPKTPGSAATVSLPAFVAGALVEHRRRQAAQRLASRHWQDNDLIFCTGIGTLLEQRNVGRVFKELARRAGIARSVHQHELRHTCATLLHLGKVDLKSISGFLRHSRLSTTSDLYVSWFADQSRAAADAMDLALAGMLEPGSLVEERG